MFALCSTSPSSRAGPGLGAKEPLGSTTLGIWHPAQVGSRGSFPPGAAQAPLRATPSSWQSCGSIPATLPTHPEPLLLEKAAPAARSERPEGWTTPHRSGTYSFSPPSRAGEEFRSRGKGLACAWSKSGAGPGAPRLPGHHRALPAHQHWQQRKVVLSNTGLTAWFHHLQSMWWFFPEGVTSQEPARPGPVPERLPKSSPVLPPAASSTELFPACSSR